MKDRENLENLFKERLKNMLFRRGDDQVHELAIEVMEGIEHEFKITLSDEEIQRLDDIAEDYPKLFED